MGILDAPPIDFRSKPLSVFNPLRDLPGVRAYFDALALPAVADGTSLKYWPDLGPFGADLHVASNATPPVYRTAGINGKAAVQFVSSTTGMSRPQAAFTPTYFPLTLAAVFQASTAGSTVTQAIVGSENTTYMGLLGSANVPPQCGLIGVANSVSSGFGGPLLNDGLPHVCVTVFDIAETRCYTDGKLTTNTNTGTAITVTMLGLSLGSATGVGAFIGNIGRAAVISGALDLGRVADLTEYLAKDYGL